MPGEHTQDDPVLAEQGKKLEEYLQKPEDEGGPGPSDGAEMTTIIIRDIIENRQKKSDSET